MKVIQKNKKASFEYIFIDEYTAGIKLLGSEVKSIRRGDVNLKNSHCYFKGDELYVSDMYISEFKESGKYQNHEPLRERKLLLNKRELKSLKEDSNIQGYTIVPKTLLLSDNGFIKLEIVLCKGKKIHDKRESLKKKDLEREFNRKFK